MPSPSLAERLRCRSPLAGTSAAVRESGMTLAGRSRVLRPGSISKALAGMLLCFWRFLALRMRSSVNDGSPLPLRSEGW